MTRKHKHNGSEGESRHGVRHTVKSLFHSGRSRTASPVGNQTAEASRIQESANAIEIVAERYSVGKMTYSSAKLILKGGQNVSGACQPLQTALAGLSAFVERVDSTVEVDEDLARLITRIDNISTVFRSARLGCLASTDDLQSWGTDLAKRINMYKKTILLKRQRNFALRFLSLEDDQQDVIETRRDLEGVFQDFLMQTTGSIASNMDKLVREHSYAQLRAACEAEYKSQSVQGCVVAARLDLLNKIEGWAQDVHGPSVLWLTGAPGVGKTCLAYTLCQRLDAQDLLGGSFFCSRESEERQDSARVLPTLAHSLACSAARFATSMLETNQVFLSQANPPDGTRLHTLTHARFRYASRLAGAIQGNLNATRFAPQYQFQTLLSQPAAAAFAEPSLPPCIFVIDAIDELKGMETFVHQVMESIACFARPARLKFVITSRSDQKLRNNLLAPGARERICLLNAVESTDILDTRTKLVQLSGGLTPQADWPLLEDVRVLAREATCQIGYALSSTQFMMALRTIT